MLEINDLSFGYTRKALLFKELDLVLEDGHVYGLLGKNGAGKSTLLKNMTGLVFPLKGQCRVNGINVSDRPVAVLEDIFFIAEEIYLPSQTPVEFVKNTAGFYPKFDKKNFYNYLELLEVDQHGNMSRQSYGQQKKAMIAFGLATNTNLMIMDEPTNGLDIPSKVQFRKLIASVQTENRCIVISTHQVRDLESLIDTMLVLHNGEILVNKSLDEVGEKLSFGIYSNTAEISALYQEENIRGKNVIMQNTAMDFSKVDIELLFNGIISGNQSLLKILNASGYEQNL
jgi:ABC-2 type transport system ATP-binding protein